MTSNILVWRIVAQILTSSLILYIIVSNNKHVVAELSVIPSWNININKTDVESCSLDTDMAEDVVKFTGYTVKTCSVQLILSNGTAALIRIPQDALVYAERQGNILNCQRKYVSFIADAPCFFVSRYPKLQLFLQGGSDSGNSITISQMSVNSSVTICQDSTGREEQHTFRVGQTHHCQAHEFDDLISCNLSPDRTCSFKFPGNCNVTLGNRVVELQCLQDNVHSSHKALTIYPPGIITLDLARQSIVELKLKPFMTLKLLKNLLLAYNDLVVLPMGLLSGLRNLEYLMLRGNRLSLLDGNMFNETKKLTKLVLWNNNLKHLPNHLFYGLGNLLELYLDENYLTILPKGLFLGLTNLKYLYLSRNQITSLDNKLFTETIKLIRLDLSVNALTVLPNGLFMELTSLKYLYLNRNQINSLNEALFEEVNKLFWLDLDDSDLTILPKGLFTGLTNLKYLYLNRNRINSLDESLFNETNKLTMLKLHDNSLTALPKVLFTGLTNLKYLYLNRNQINTLNEGMFDETNKLYELFLDGNSLKILPKRLFIRLTNLKYLYVSRNQIALLDEILFTETINLIMLDLSDNALTVLPNGLFTGLTNLKYLYLNRNQINSLDGALFKENNKLTELHLTENNLTVLPKEVFMRLGNLEYLYLSKNHINSLDEALFDKNNKLTALDLEENNLTVLTKGVFTGLRNLEILYLSGNQINSLEETLLNETNKLIELHLVGNNVVNLPNQLFKGMGNLVYLSLSENQINTLQGELFNENNKLTKLYLAGNNLTVLPNGLYMGMGNLETLSLLGNRINSLDKELFSETNKLTVLTLSYNNLTIIPNGLFRELKHLSNLIVRGNQINSLHKNLFNETKTLTEINFHHNNLVRLPNELFKGLGSLVSLYLNNNKLVNVHVEMFRDLINLQMLYLGQNRLQSLNFDLFKYTKNIKILDLSSNELTIIPDISNIGQLFYLNVKDNSMTGITNETFSNLAKETYLVVSQHEICVCYVPDDITCTAADDKSPFLTCDRLLSDRVLVLIMWLIGVNALCGNIFVLCLKQKTIDKNKVQTFLLRNLAMSDLLMGVYMALIASADVYFGKYFPMQAETWRSGLTCRIAGTISIISSEASVFFVTIISIDRFVSTKYHNSRCKLRKMSSVVVAIVLWTIALVLGIIPSTLAGNNDKFYDNSHVCIGLPLSKLKVYKTTESEEWSFICPDDNICYWKQPIQSQYLGEVNGMVFASVMFLGLNFLCYLVILACYIEIIWTVFKSSKRAGLNPDMKEQIRLTAKVAAIVITDFACWFPIIIIGILVQAGVLTLPPDVFAWCVTFVLPINSAINPYLYTIAAIINSRLKKARIAPVENQQENTNMASGGRRQMSSQSQNTQDTALRCISHDTLLTGPESHDDSNTCHLPSTSLNI